MRQPHERLAHWLGQFLGRADLRTLVAASLAAYGGIGWMHDKLQALDALQVITTELDARQVTAAAHEAELRAEVRELRIELHYAEQRRPHE